jgi:hypothetical protein
MSAHARTRCAEPFEYWRLKLLRMLEPGIWSFKTTVDAACARSIVAFDDVAPEDLNHHGDPRGSRSSRFSTLRLISMYSMPSAQPPKDVTVAVDVDPYQLL